DDLGRRRAGEVDRADGTTVVDEAVRLAGQVRVDAGDDTGAVDARRDGRGRARDAQDLIDAAREGEGGRGRGAHRRIEDERAHRGAAVAVEDERDRGTGIVGG